MTVFIFNTSKQVGDSELLRSSPAATPPKPGSRKTISKAWPWSSGMKRQPTEAAGPTLAALRNPLCLLPGRF